MVIAQAQQLTQEVAEFVWAQARKYRYPKASEYLTVNRPDIDVDDHPFGI